MVVGKKVINTATIIIIIIIIRMANIPNKGSAAQGISYISLVVDETMMVSGVCGK